MEVCKVDMWTWFLQIVYTLYHRSILWLHVCRTQATFKVSWNWPRCIFQEDNKLPCINSTHDASSILMCKRVSSYVVVLECELIQIKTSFAKNSETCVLKHSSAFASSCTNRSAHLKCVVESEEEVQDRWNFQEQFWWHALLPSEAPFAWHGLRPPEYRAGWPLWPLVELSRGLGCGMLARSDTICGSSVWCVYVCSLRRWHFELSTFQAKKICDSLALVTQSGATSSQPQTWTPVTTCEFVT